MNYNDELKYAKSKELNCADATKASDMKNVIRNVTGTIIAFISSS